MAEVERQVRAPKFSFYRVGKWVNTCWSFLFYFGLVFWDKSKGLMILLIKPIGISANNGRTALSGTGSGTVVRTAIDNV